MNYRFPEQKKTILTISRLPFTHNISLYIVFFFTYNLQIVLYVCRYVCMWRAMYFLPSGRINEHWMWMAGQMDGWMNGLNVWLFILAVSNTQVPSNMTTTDYLCEYFIIVLLLLLLLLSNFITLYAFISTTNFTSGYNVATFDKVRKIVSTYVIHMYILHTYIHTCTYIYTIQV